jgi:hypothetical protein
MAHYPGVAMILALGSPLALAAHAHHCDGPQRIVRLVLAAPVQPVSTHFSRGRAQKADPAQGDHCRFIAQTRWIVACRDPQGRRRLRSYPEPGQQPQCCFQTGHGRMGIARQQRGTGCHALLGLDLERHVTAAVRCAHDQGTQLVNGLGPGLDGAPACHVRDSQSLGQAVVALGMAPGVARQDGAGTALSASVGSLLLRRWSRSGRLTSMTWMSRFIFTRASSALTGALLSAHVSLPCRWALTQSPPRCFGRSPPSVLPLV